MPPETGCLTGVAPLCVAVVQPWSNRADITPAPSDRYTNGAGLRGAGGTLGNMSTNFVEDLREPRISIAQPACQVDQDLGLSGRPLVFSNDGLQPLAHGLSLSHHGNR